MVPSFAPGVYTAQVVNQGGITLATTGAFTAHAGDVIHLVPVIPNGPLATIAGLFANSTSSVVNSAASGGVLAVQAGEPISPERIPQ
jgi:hypothetical protein